MRMLLEKIDLKIAIIFLLATLGTSAIQADGGSDKRFCFYDLTDHLRKTSGPNLKRVAAYLRKARADVLILGGVRSESEMREFKRALGFRFAKMVKAKDPQSHLAMFAKTTPASYQEIADEQYTIKKGIKLKVLRGIIHSVFDFSGYKLHVFGAQLKDQTKHPKYLHTNMRRYEARILKKLVSAVIKKDLNANVLVLADLNDSCGKSPVKAVYARRFGLPKRLYDIRPLDSINVSWTFLDEKRDDYNRVDYALVSFALIPEVNYSACEIIEDPNWRKLSAHRAIVVSISCADKDLWDIKRVKSIFPNSIRSNEASIGIKRKRGEKTADSSK